MDGYGSGGTAAVPSTSMQKWYDQQQHHSGTEEIRSVTPAMNNTRGSFRHHSPAGNSHGGPNPSYATPTGADAGGRYDTVGGQRYLGAYNSPDGAAGGNGSVGPSADAPHQPSSTGLIRLSLRKPMGIVFEPMYDPNNASLQRGVRICDLPRT